jgi:choline dehydrogenase-like flavoprotein
MGQRRRAAVSAEQTLSAQSLKGVSMPVAIGSRGNPYDVIIVGAGATGGWAAMRLGAAGMNVLLLEAGPYRPRASSLRARVDSIFEGYVRPFWPGRNRREARLRALARRQPIQSLCYAWAGDPEAFVDDLDNPYVATGDPFHWFRTRQVGGRLAVRHHGRRFMRFTDHDFKSAARDGGQDWPVSEAELAPHYAQVERRVGWVAREDNFAERWLRQVLARAWPVLGMVPISKVRPPDLTALALRTGNVTLHTGAIVSHLELDPGSNEVSAVSLIDANTHARGEAFGRRVFMCASTIETTRVLLNSRSARYPDGIGNASGVLGRHFMEQVHVYAQLSLPSAQRDTLPPQSIDLFVPSRPGERGNDFGVQVMSGRVLPRRDLQVCLSSFGEMLPRPENRVTLSATTKDRWGLPVAEIHYRLSDRERQTIGEQRRFLWSLTAAGVDVEVEGSDKPLGYAIHEVGTARMGADPRTSFLDPSNRSWEVKNLYITDGASFVTSSYRNPTLTMLALTERACAHVLLESIRSRAEPRLTAAGKPARAPTAVVR